MSTPLPVVLLLSALLVGCAPAVSGGPPATDTAPAVSIQGFAFLPADLTVKVGSTVTWTNQDAAPHTATADDNSFTTSTLSRGQSGSVTFTRAGTFAYHCAVHPNMKAMIHVVAP